MARRYPKYIKIPGKTGWYFLFYGLFLDPIEMDQFFRQFPDYPEDSILLEGVKTPSK